MNDFFFKTNTFLILIFIIQIIQLNTQGFTSIITGNSNNGKNTYYITLYIGQLKIPKTFLIDTTGSLVSYKCNLNSEEYIINCKNNYICNNYPYSSCKDNKYKFEYNYNNIISKGIYTNQHISFLEKGESYIFPIGCIKSDTEEFLSQGTDIIIDGILGLNMNNNSFIDLLYKEKIIFNKKFSICLNQKEGGYLSFGAVSEEYIYLKDKNYKKIIINYIPYTILENGAYSLEINSLNNNEKKNNLILEGENQLGVIDSMSVKTYLEESLYNKLMNEFLNYCIKIKGNCNKIQKIDNFGYCSNFKSKQEIIKSINKYWPKIIIGFNGYNHILTPENYFIAYSSSDSIKACIGFEKSDKNYNIFGTNFLNGYNVLFDNEIKKIGFFESNCEIEEKKVKNYQNEQYINRVFDDPVNVIIVCISIGGIIVLIVLLILLYRLYYNRTPRRKGYIRQVDIINSINPMNSYIDYKK